MSSATIKRKRKSGIVRRSRRIATEKETFKRTTTEIWEGPLSELEAKQNVWAKDADSTSLSPTEGGNGSLEIVTSVAMEVPNSRYGFGGAAQTTIEIEWVELRKKLETHPFFEGVSDEDRVKIKQAIDNPDPGQSPALSGMALELYLKLLRGQTEYSMAVPVVRRTTHRPSSTNAQGAWFRDSPPVSVPGGWEWLKTANRITTAGRDVNRVEEWTGAEEWDTDIYPAT